MVTDIQLRNEKLYQCTIALARSMLNRQLILREEYHRIDTIFTEKYAPTLGTLFADIDLINHSSRANMGH